MESPPAFRYAAAGAAAALAAAGAGWALGPWWTAALVGLGVAAGLGRAARRAVARESGWDDLTFAAQAQAERLKDLNARLSLQALEIADQAAEIERQRAWLETVIAQLPVGVMLVDPVGRVVSRNHRFNAFLGLSDDAPITSLDDFRGWPVETPAGEPVPHDDLPLSRALGGGLVTDQREMRVARRGGGWSDQAVSAAPISGPGGSLIGAVLAVADLAPVRQAERRAKADEDRLRFALRAAGMIAWEWDLDTGVIRRSEPLEVWLGLDPDPRFGAAGTFLPRVHPDDRPRVEEVQSRFRAGDTAECDYVVRLRREDGEYVWLESRGRALRDAAGRPTRTVAGVLIDITARKAAEERVRLLESAVVHARDAIIVLEGVPQPGAGRAVLYANGAFSAITGYARDEAVGRSLHFLRGRDTDPGTLDRIRQALEAARPFKGEVLNYRKDGTEVWVDVSLVPVTGADGRLAHFVMIQRDITGRKKTEEALRRSEAMFRGFFESTAAGVSLTGPTGRFVSVNPAFAALVGLPADHVIGRHPRELTHPDDWEAQAELVADLLAGRRDGYQTRKRYVRPDGTEVWTELSVAAVRGPDGALLYGLGVSVDVTERRRLEEQLRQAQKMEALGQLAGGVAHDFNNLLTAVLGNLALVRLPAGDPHAPLLRTVEAAAGRAADLTRKLLGYARRNQLLVAPVPPADLIDEVVDILRRTLDPRIQIVTDVRTDAPALADATLVNQALLNLCLNGRDAMPAGGRLSLTADEVDATPPGGPPPGRFVRLTVADTGHGMPPDVVGRLFEPFFTTKGVGRGTGLGLPMVHGIMQQHDGWVAVESAIGTGTRFELYLPVAHAGAGGVSPPPRLGPTEEPPEESAPAAGTILLVDDESMIRDLGRAVLETAGYTVLEAVDGADAVEVFTRESSRIDLVILDLTMPRLSGRDAFRAMLDHDPEARVLFSSGYSADDLTDADGALGLLSKPYRPPDLLAAVRRALSDSPTPAGVGS